MDSSLKSTLDSIVHQSLMPREPPTSNSTNGYSYIDAESSKSKDTSCESQQGGNESISSVCNEEILVPNVVEDIKPKVKQVFKSLDEGVDFYMHCAEEGGFYVNLSTVKRVRGEFVEQHNHKLVSKDNLHLLRANGKLDYVEQSFHSQTYNIGATKSYTLLSSIKGGYNVRGGTVTDYKNFKRDLNCSVGDSDAQMLVDTLRDRKNYVPNFFFDYKIDDSYLTGLFWADEVSKCNYKEFGDVVSFDATYRTNKYHMAFVSFTRIDNHRRCVTFGARLLANESTESYVWLLKTFL